MNIKKILITNAAIAAMLASAAVSASAETVPMDGSAAYGYNVTNEGSYDGNYCFARTKETIDLGKVNWFNQGNKTGYLWSNGAVDENTEVSGLHLYNNMYYIGEIDNVVDLESIKVSGMLSNGNNWTNWFRLYVIDNAPEDLVSTDQGNSTFIFERTNDGYWEMGYEYEITSTGVQAKIGDMGKTLYDVSEPNIPVDSDHKLKTCDFSKNISSIIANDTNNDNKLHVYVSVRNGASINVSYTTKDTEPSGQLTENIENADWGYTGDDGKYTTAGNTITDGTETVYGYKATFSAFEDGTYTNAVLTADPVEEGKKIKTAEKELGGITLEAGGGAIFYVISNAQLDTSTSSITLE